MASVGSDAAQPTSKPIAARDDGLEVWLLCPSISKGKQASLETITFNLEKLPASQRELDGYVKQGSTLPPSWEILATMWEPQLKILRGFVEKEKVELVMLKEVLSQYSLTVGMPPKDFHRIIYIIRRLRIEKIGPLFSTLPSSIATNGNGGSNISNSNNNNNNNNNNNSNQNQSSSLFSSNLKPASTSLFGSTPARANGANSPFVAVSNTQSATVSTSLGLRAWSALPSRDANTAAETRVSPISYAGSLFGPGSVLNTASAETEVSSRPPPLFSLACPSYSNAVVRSSSSSSSIIIGGGGGASGSAQPSSNSSNTSGTA